MDSRSCLITLIHEYDDLLLSRLNSAVPFVDSWVLVDFTPAKELPGNIAAVLSNTQGKHLRLPFAGYDSALNEAMHEAALMADVMLYLAPDEKLLMTSECLPNDADSNIYLVEVQRKAYSEWLPRLVPLKQGLVYESALSAALCADHNVEKKVLRNIAIQNMGGGIWEQRIFERDRKLMAQQVVNETQNYAIKLSFARLELQASNLKAAKILLQDLISVGEALKNEQRWLSYYLLANIEITEADTLADSAENAENKAGPDYQYPIQLLQECIEIDPNRAESYIRLVALLKSQGNLLAALEIAKLIIELDEHPSANYVEPLIQRYSARLELADLHYQLENIEACRKVASSIRLGPDLPTAVARKIKYLADAPDQRDPIGLIKTIKQTRANTPQQEVVEAQPRLTIGMATYDDFDGVYFSLMSILLYHPEVLSQIEIVIIDNNPSSAHGESVKSLCKRANNVRYFEAGEYQGTTIRERVFIEAKGQFVMCMDCHVFMHAGTIARLIEYCAAHQDSLDLIHGPMIDEDLASFTTHMEPYWSEGFYGKYESDQRAKHADAEPFEIPMQGMGLFVCRREAWLGFNRRFRGFGGEEGYIHEKFRHAGGRVLCLPSLRWTHRFFRPEGTKYSNVWEDRIRNYLIGWNEVGLDTSELLQHFAEHVGSSITATAHAQFTAEKNGPLWPFADIYCLVKDERQSVEAQSTLAALSIEKTAQLIYLSDHDDSRSKALSHILGSAKGQSLTQIVLINLDEDKAHASEVLHLANTVRRNMQAAEILDHQCLVLSDETPAKMPQAMLLKDSAFDYVMSLVSESQTIDCDVLRSSDLSVWTAS